MTDVTGPFMNGNTFSNGTVTATVNGSMSAITIIDISIFMALFEFNSSFIFLGYNVNGFNFNSAGVFLAVSFSGSPAIYAGGQYFKTGSLNGAYPAIKVSNCPPEDDSTTIINSYVSNQEQITAFAAGPIPLNHTIHSDLSQRFKMVYRLNHGTVTGTFSVGQTVTDTVLGTTATITNVQSGYILCENKSPATGIFSATGTTTITTTTGSAILNKVESHMVYTGIENINIMAIGRLDIAPASGTNILLIGYIAKNDVVKTRTKSPSRISSGTFESVMPKGTFNLSTNDFIEFFVENQGNSANIKCNDIDIEVFRI